MKCPKSKSRRLLLLVLLGAPVLLLLVSLKIAQKRPHLFMTFKSQVSAPYLTEDGKSVCLGDKCYNKNTRERVSASSLRLGVVQHRGPFYFESDMDGDILFYEIRDGKTKRNPSWRSDLVLTVFSPDKRVVTLASRNEVKQ